MQCKIKCRLIFLLAIIYFPLLTSLYFTYLESSETVKKMILKNNENIAKGIKREIENLLEDKNKLFVSFANNPIVIKKDTKKIDEFFSNVYKECSYCLNILLADMNGNNIGSAVNPEKAHKLNYLDMDWFKNAIHGKPTINNPHTSKLFNEKTFMMTYPVFLGSKQIAVLGIPINLNKLNYNLMKEYKLKDKTNILIINDKGIVLSNLLFPELIGKPVKRKELLEVIFSNNFGNTIQTGIDGIERLYTYETIEKYNWKVVVGTPTKTLFQETVKNIKNVLITSIFLIIFTFFLALRISKGINKKFDTLISGIEHFGKGEFSYRFNSEGIKDEFKNIFQTFNLMAENIEKNNNEILKLNRLYKLLSEVNQKIVKNREIQRLLNDVCKDVVEIGEYKSCIFLKIEDNIIKPLSFYGIDDEILRHDFFDNKELKNFEIIKNSVLNKITTISAKNNKKYFHYDYDSLISVPLIINNNIFGVLLVFKKNSDFNYQEIKLLEELASDISFAINSINITNEKRKTEKLLSGIFEGMGEGLALIDRDYKIIMANKKYFEIIEKTPEEVLYKNCYNVVYGFDTPCFFKQDFCAIKEIFEDGKERTKVIELKNKSGITKTINLRFFPLFQNKKIEYVIEIVNDVTELKKLETQYLHAQKMESIGRFSAGIAHDFNNILTGIIGFATLSKTEKNIDVIQKNLTNIIDLSNKAANLTKSLLAFSRKSIPVFEHIDINKLISDMIKMLQRIVGEDILIEYKSYEKPLFVFADPIQIEQVLMNLSTNAKDAMPQGGKIIVEITQTKIDEKFINLHNYGRTGEYALISFTDTGTGISEENLNKIFEPFFTTKEVGKGTGLGLSVVYGIIKNHDGFINVYSELGKGTTFKIYLPLSYRKIETSKIDTESLFDQNLLIKALLIDDDNSVREVTKKTLESYGINVTETDNVENAINIINNQTFDIIISDVIMPSKTGIDLYSEVRKKGINTPFLFISGYPADFISEKYGIEVENILIKPITPLSILNKIKSILKK